MFDFISKLMTGEDTPEMVRPEVVKSAKEKLEIALTEKLDSVLEEVINEKEDLEKKRAQLENGRSASSELITKAAYTNAAISGAMALIPGPWGLLAVVPEMYLILKNQMTLIRDLSIAYGHKDKLNKELLTYLFASSVGAGGLGLVVMHGSKVLVRRAGLGVMQKIISILGGKITQQALKTTISHWLPLVGAAAMAAWSKYSTEKIGEICCELLEKEIVLLDEEASEADVIEIAQAEHPGVPLESIKIFINLAKVDGLATQEVAFFKSKLANLNIPEVEKLKLQVELLNQNIIPVDYSVFGELDKVLLMENVKLLMNSDGKISDQELQVENEIRKNLGLMTNKSNL
jgi:uncharacterized protein (DUF697 family)